MQTAWQHTCTWRLYDTIATPHTEQAAASTPLRHMQQRSLTPNCRAKGKLHSSNLSHISPSTSLPVMSLCHYVAISCRARLTKTQGWMAAGGKIKRRLASNLFNTHTKSTLELPRSFFDWHPTFVECCGVVDLYIFSRQERSYLQAELCHYMANHP